MGPYSLSFWLFNVDFFSQISRVLHPRLVHRGQEADVSLLPRKGRPQEDVPQPLGEAPHDVRQAVGLAPVARLLAARRPRHRPGHQLGIGTRIIKHFFCDSPLGAEKKIFK